MNKQHLSPEHVVLDLVLRYSATMPMLGHAAVLHGSLIFSTRNHRGEFVSMSLPVNFDGTPSEDPPRWVLFKLGPSVWKLSPSVLDRQLHAYITIIGVPEDVDWPRSPHEKYVPSG